MRIEVQAADAELVLGIVVARGVAVTPSPAGLLSQINALVAQRAQEDFPPPPVKEAVRDLLRRGGFRPAGRNKPSCEYLAQAAREGRFPRINSLVDINNLLSLEIGLPISLLDLSAVGDHAIIRLGRKDERYIFNTGGQVIDVEGLICVCRAAGTTSEPLGNPIKDSMAGKLKDHTTAVIGVIYGSSRVVDSSAMTRHIARFAGLLHEFASASDVEQHILRGDKMQ